MKTKYLAVTASAAFALAVFAFDSREASAQCGYGYGGGYNSFGYSGYAYPRTSFSIGVGSYNRYPSYSYYGSVRGHYDYHPPSVYRHRNHFHVSPGHYDFHRGRHHRGFRH